jgi:hypothetical protein
MLAVPRFRAASGVPHGHDPPSHVVAECGLHYWCNRRPARDHDDQNWRWHWLGQWRASRLSDLRRRDDRQRSYGDPGTPTDRLTRECPIPKPRLVLEHVAYPHASLLRRHRRRPRSAALHRNPGALQRRQPERPGRPTDASPVFAADPRNHRPESGVKFLVETTTAPCSHGRGVPRIQCPISQAAQTHRLVPPPPVRVIPSCLRMWDAPRAGVFAQTTAVEPGAVNDCREKPWRMLPYLPAVSVVVHHGHFVDTREKRHASRGTTSAQAIRIRLRGTCRHETGSPAPGPASGA